MCQNQPDLVRSLHQSGQLGEHLANKVGEAAMFVEKQLQQGRGINEAWDQAHEELLAPANPEGADPRGLVPLPPAEVTALLKSTVVPE